MFAAREVVQPACYRCPYNRATPERGVDARLSRKCQWECVDEVESQLANLGETASAFVLEPRVQGAGSMSMQPQGYLSRVAEICRARGVWLMLDEVLTGFGRTGPLFAAQGEHVTPDIVALGKGITGGYMPLAATLASDEIYSAFLGEYEEFKTFFHGHSYSGNQLGCAVAKASLGLLQTTHTETHRAQLASHLGTSTQRFWHHSNVGDVRCDGTICAIELVKDFATRERFPVGEKIGFRVCEAARKHGLLTRNIGDVLVLMPPYCTTPTQIEEAAHALYTALNEILPIVNSTD